MERLAAVMVFILMISTTLHAGTELSVEYLYWKVQEDQLYPVISFDQYVSNGLNIFDLTPQNQKFAYTSGVRVSGRYDCCCRNYDLNFAWTHIHPCTTRNISSSDILISFIDQTNTNLPQATSGESQWNLNYDILDLTLGCEYMICRRFSIRPNIGLKGGWINQTQEITVNNVALDGPPPTAFAQGSVKRRNNFSGVGPRLGVDLRYGLGSCFGIFSTFGGALLFGDGALKTTTFLSDTLDNDDDPIGPQLTTLNNPGSRLSSTVQLLLGVDWTYCLYQKYEIFLGVAYEAQLWWNQLRSINSIPQALMVNSPAGNLMMQGLTLQMSFEF
jgi:hypothetical protein